MFVYDTDQCIIETNYMLYFKIGWTYGDIRD